MTPISIYLGTRSLYFMLCNWQPGINGKTKSPAPGLPVAVQHKLSAANKDFLCNTLQFACYFLPSGCEVLFLLIINRLMGERKFILFWEENEGKVVIESADQDFVS